MRVLFPRRLPRTDEEKQRLREEERLRKEQMSGYSDVPDDGDFDEFRDREVDE